MRSSKIIVLMPLLLAMFTIHSATAQSTSYSANSIPVGGTQSIAFGVDALKVNTGLRNLAIGRNALAANTDGAFNLAIGDDALFTNTSASFNTAVGGGNLYLNTSGNRNTAIGSSVMFFNTTGEWNTASGFKAMSQNTTGSRNTATAMDALLNNTTGNYNSAYGFQSMVLNTIGNDNTAYGHRSLWSNVEGSRNTALGDSAGQKALGSGNVFIGFRAGATDVGSNKFYLANNANNTLIYGDFSSQQVLIGNANPEGYVFKGNRKLNVLGGILTDSIRVALSGTWSDYVFADDYPLRTTDELASFIKINKHLPNVPSAKEVAAQGINLVDMNAKLLEKIEELTLYMLQQQQQINELQKLVKKN